MDASLISTAVIFVAELGDKSQLMVLTFATRFKTVPVLPRCRRLRRAAPHRSPLNRDIGPEPPTGCSCEEVLYPCGKFVRLPGDGPDQRAPWCSSRRALAPHIEHAATTSGVPVLDLQVDADPNNLVETFTVRSVPTLIGLRDGTEVARLTGAQPPTPSKRWGEVGLVDSRSAMP